MIASRNKGDFSAQLVGLRWANAGLALAVNCAVSSGHMPYVALPFVASDDGVAAGEPTECFKPNAAVMRAEALSRKEGHVGAVAFSRTGDPATGDFSDAKVIRKFGEVPDDLSAV